MSNFVVHRNTTVACDNKFHQFVNPYVERQDDSVHEEQKPSLSIKVSNLLPINAISHLT